MALDRVKGALDCSLLKIDWKLNLTWFHGLSLSPRYKMLICPKLSYSPIEWLACCDTCKCYWQMHGMVVSYSVLLVTLRSFKLAKGTGWDYSQKHVPHIHIVKWNEWREELLRFHVEGKLVVFHLLVIPSFPIILYLPTWTLGCTPRFEKLQETSLFKAYNWA